MQEKVEEEWPCLELTEPKFGILSQFTRFFYCFLEKLISFLVVQVRLWHIFWLKNWLKKLINLCRRHQVKTNLSLLIQIWSGLCRLFFEFLVFFFKGWTPIEGLLFFHFHS